MNADGGKKTYGERGVLEGVRVVVTETCSPAGFYQAAPLCAEGTVWAVYPNRTVYPLLLDVNNRIMWAGDVEKLKKFPGRA